MGPGPGSQAQHPAPFGTVDRAWGGGEGHPWSCVLAVQLPGGVGFVEAPGGLLSQDPQRPGALSLPLSPPPRSGGPAKAGHHPRGTV